jgi:hypothetical protein
MPQKDFDLVNKMLERSIDHEKLFQRLKEIDIINFIKGTQSETIENSEKLSKLNTSLKKQKDIVINEVVKIVNTQVSGPITQVKLDKAINDFKVMEFQQGIDEVQAKVFDLLTPRIEKTNEVILINL